MEVAELLLNDIHDGRGFKLEYILNEGSNFKQGPSIETFKGKVLFEKGTKIV